MSNEPTGADGATTRARIEALLASYPQLEADELVELKHWFRRTASALDVGLVASNETIAPAYRAFRAAHLDGFTPADLLRALAFSAVLLTGVGLILWRALQAGA